MNQPEPRRQARAQGVLYPALVLMLLALSGNPFVKTGASEIALASFVVILLILITFKRYLPDLRLTALCGLFFMVFMIQVFTLDSLPLIAMAGFFCMVIAAWATARLVPGFPRVYVKVMVGLAVMSLFFWAVGLSGLAEPLLAKIRLQPVFTRQWTGDRLYTIIVHTYLFSGRGGTLRNAGMFGEPGLFAGYLVWALVLLRIYKQEFSSRQYRWYLLLLTATMLSTLSTAAYILLPLALLPHFARRPRSKKAYPVIAAVLIVLACLALIAPKISRLSFLWPKISAQFQATTTHDSGWEKTRFGSIVFDMDYIKQKPLFGWGPLPETRFGTQEITGMGNGLSGFTVKYGVVGMLAYALLLFTSLRRMTGKGKVLCAYYMVLAILMLNGEPFLNYPLFWAMGFIGARETAFARERVRLLRRRSPGAAVEATPALTSSTTSSTDLG